MLEEAAHVSAKRVGLRTVYGILKPSSSHESTTSTGTPRVRFSKRSGAILCGRRMHPAEAG
jgi:hypothetical protein